MKKKNIWIFNHYASNTFFDRGGRHYSFAKYLIRAGYSVTIFCANTVHNSDIIVNTEGKLYIEDEVEGIPYVFVKTSEYKGNGIKRIINMMQFYKRLIKVSKEYMRSHAKPNIILASSVHPLTLVSGIKIAKRTKISCICEIRDLWPESLVEYGIIVKNNPITLILRRLERSIYENADALIFTMEGGKDYIKERKWDIGSGGIINLNKVHYINNGVDLELYQENRQNFNYNDVDLDSAKYFKVIYTGSIRHVNQVGLIVGVGKYLQDKGIDDVKFIIFGEGTERKQLEERCLKENICNVIFKGKISKNYIPSVISKGNLNIMLEAYNALFRFGISPNKFFDYFAAGKPTVSSLNCSYDNIEKNKCGITIKTEKINDIAETVLYFKNLDEAEYQKYCENAISTAKKFDFAVLTEKLIDVIEE